MAKIKWIFYIWASIIIMIFNIDTTFIYKLYDYEKYQVRSGWGTVMLPKGWVAQEIDGLAYFIDEATGEIIAEEYYYTITNNIAEGAEYHQGGDNYTHYIYNEKYNNYREKENVNTGGSGSNGALYGENIYFINQREETRQLKYFDFRGSEFNRLIMLIFKDVSDSELRAITDSYVDPRYI